ncbi:hypothetical protein IMZ48_04640 [Candidatus Bathyarchaeota archaeon]|nr:hypothetical protein [Candidatus Bathyarchaeota archaeon]
MAWYGLNAPGPKTYPQCGVMTKKTIGCEHIACLCEERWCHACGKGYYTMLL